MTKNMGKTLVALAVGAMFTASGAAMATTLTWDSSGTSPTTPVDGSGAWNTTGTNWSNGSTDSSWATSGGYSTTASFGSNNGAAGTVTLGANITAAGLTFNPATSGDYTIAGSGSYVLELTGGGALTGAPIVTNANATISAGTYFYNGVNFTGTGQLTLSGAITNVTGNMPVNFSGGGTVNINTNFNAGSSSYMSWATGGSVVNINNNATFTAPFLFEVGNNTGTTTININTGGVMANTGQYLFCYAGGQGSTVNVNAGGQMQAYQIELGQTQPGVLNLNGGLINADWIHTNNAIGGTLNLNGGTLEASGAAGPAGLYSPWIASTASNPMTVNVLNGGATFEVPTSYNAVVTATLLQGTNADGSLSTGGISLTGGGTLTLESQETYTGPTSIQSGTLALAHGGSIADSSSITVSSGATFDVSALGGGYTIGSHQSLIGTGTVAGNLTVQGSLQPGSAGSTGTLAFNNNLTFSGTTISVALDSSGNADNIVIDGTAAVSGTNTINVSSLGTSLTSGLYTLITDANGGLAGTFLFSNGANTETFTLGSNSYMLSLANSSTAETINVAAVPEPATLGLFTIGGLALVLVGRKRKARA